MFNTSIGSNDMKGLTEQMNHLSLKYAVASKSGDNSKATKSNLSNKETLELFGQVNNLINISKQPLEPQYQPTSSQIPEITNISDIEYEECKRKRTRPYYITRNMVKRCRYPRITLRRQCSHSTGGVMMMIMGHLQFEDNTSPFRTYQIPQWWRRSPPRRTSRFYMCASRLARSGGEFTSTATYPTTAVTPPPSHQNDGRPDGQSRMDKIIRVLYSDLPFARDPIYSFP